MPEAHLDPKHVGILMRSHAKYAVRGGSGLTFVLMVVLLGLVVASLLIDPIEDLRKDMERTSGRDFPRAQFIAMVVENATPLVRFWVGAPEGDPQIPHLLNEKPALLSVMFLILLAFEPFVMAFGAFNQLSGDIANRGLRYLLLRTSRLNIVISRLLGTFLFSAVTSFFTIAVIVAFLATRFEIYPLGDLVTWGLWGWGAINVFSLPYLALCTWISTTIASPFAALAISQLAIGIPIVLLKYAKRPEFGNTEWLERLTPWGWKTDLLHPDLAKVGLAAAVMIGFFLLFAFLGARHFLKRDL
jgi:ABC-type Na+ efflux pump permease subunit